MSEEGNKADSDGAVGGYDFNTFIFKEMEGLYSDFVWAINAPSDEIDSRKEAIKNVESATIEDASVSSRFRLRDKYRLSKANENSFGNLDLLKLVKYFHYLSVMYSDSKWGASLARACDNEWLQLTSLLSKRYYDGKRDRIGGVGSYD